MLDEHRLTLPPATQTPLGRLDPAGRRGLLAEGRRWKDVAGGARPGGSWRRWTAPGAHSRACGGRRPDDGVVGRPVSGPLRTVHA